MSTRRQFMRHIGGLAAALGLLPGALAAAVPAVATANLGKGLRRRDLAPRHGDTFLFQDPLRGTRTQLVLVNVRPGPAVPHLDQFSLIFRGPAGQPLQPGIHWVADPRGVGFPLLAIPSGETARGRLYRADCVCFV